MMILIISHIIAVSSAFAGICPGYPEISPEQLREQPELSKKHLEQCESQAKQGDITSQRALGNVYCALDFGRLSSVTRACINWFLKAELDQWQNLEKNLEEDLLFAIAWTLKRSDNHEEQQKGTDILKRIAIYDDSTFNLVHDDLYRQYEQVANKSDIFNPNLQAYVQFMTDVASIDDEMNHRGIARSQMSMFYANGIGVVADLTKSRYWMSRAAVSSGKYEIEYIKMVKLGLSAPPNHQLAENLFNQFVEKQIKFNQQFDTCDTLMRFATFGFSSAMSQLAEAYKNGQHKNCIVAVNQDLAKSWKDLADKFEIIEH